MAARWIAIVSWLIVTLPGTVAAQPAKPPTPKDGPLGMKFVPLAKGTFYMGGGRLSVSKKVEIEEDFEIAVHTVTQGQWQALMASNPSYFSRNGKGKDKVKDITDADLKHFPVEKVSWDDAQEYIKKLNDQERGKGYRYRLPTVAESEYACRGGATAEEECSYQFYFARPSNDLSSQAANFNGNMPAGKADKGPFLGRTTKVGSYLPNKLGLYDMHGNVWQWCEDVSGAKGQDRMMRGGCWNDTGDICQAASILPVGRTGAGSGTGFRLLRVSVR